MYPVHYKPIMDIGTNLLIYDLQTLCTHSVLFHTSVLFPHYTERANTIRKYSSLPRDFHKSISGTLIFQGTIKNQQVMRRETYAT